MIKRKDRYVLVLWNNENAWIKDTKKVMFYPWNILPYHIFELLTIQGDVGQAVKHQVPVEQDPDDRDPEAVRLLLQAQGQQGSTSRT